jgi:Tol biopolymer transport system component
VYSPLVWFNRSGSQTGIIQLGASGDLELSPDGAQATVTVFDLNSDIWTVDLKHESRTRFTFDTAHEGMSAWSPDGRIAFSRSARGGGMPGGDLYVKPANVVAAEEVLLQNSLEKYPMSWSPDGRFLLFGVDAGPPTNRDLWVLPLLGDRKPYPILQTRFNETFGKFSPDGRWVVFTSNEAERNDVYVMPFPGPGPKVLVSRAGGDLPRWRRDGKEIFYVAPDNRLIAATVNGRGSTFEVEAAQTLFEVHPGGFRYFYDVTPDGERFLVMTQREQPSSITPITLVVNWAAQLKRK